MTPKSKLLLSALPALLFFAAPVNAATILGWNKDNVDVGTDPATVGDTGVSVVYDRDATDPNAVTNGRIAFPPPEAVSPGIYVVPETYTQGGSDPLTFDKPAVFSAIRELPKAPEPEPEFKSSLK